MSDTKGEGITVTELQRVAGTGIETPTGGEMRVGRGDGLGAKARLESKRSDR